MTAVPDARWLLWALDEVAPSLAERTIGSGAGTRTELLNRIHRQCPDGFELVVIADDDVEIMGYQFRLFLKAAKAAALDLSQPAHLCRSYHSWPFVRQRLFTLIRLTHFVEQGPIVAFSQSGLASCFPLPESLGMGWGVEAEWARKSFEGLRLGVVDAAGMRHRGVVSAGYDRQSQHETGLQAVRGAGFSSYADFQVDCERWALGAARPNWVGQR